MSVPGSVPSPLPRDPVVDLELARKHGLRDSEYDHLVRSLGRAPTFTELGIVSVMWSEHCSYKSSKKLLRTLPTEGPAVVQGPGENAGAVGVGDGEAIVFKIESHNHPSAVEPYQGAATGVGGILRDIFTMGARPIAMLNSLRFGDVRKREVKHLAEGVVHGIADYGNCVGVPTVAGEVYFDPCYEGNPLVNAMCVGRIRVDRLTKAVARTPGALVVYFGNPTGRDGVHGATFASEELTEETKAQRSAVQVGDPFMGKKILEATLDLIEAGCLEAIQDMGAAGLTCSSCEMGSRGGVGVRIDLDAVPARVGNLSPYEIMLSESQERMLAVCAPECLPQVEAILGRWDLKAHVVGVVTDGGDLSVWFQGAEVARLPNRLLADEAPLYDLPGARPDYLDRLPTFERPPAPLSRAELRAAAVALLGDPNIASKRWIHERYDSQVQTNTVQRPGGGAAVLRLEPETPGAPVKHVALTVDCNAVFCYLDPREGAKLAVAEAARNLACVGARGLGVTNNLNFGNPNKPGVFWQLAESVAGIGEACRALDTPVTGGNVSLYNENPTGAVYPTPTIGMVGLVRDPSKVVTPFAPRAGLDLWLLGPDPTTLGGSTYARHRMGGPAGPCPRVDLGVEAKLHALLLDLIGAGRVLAAQDLSEGGLFVAAIEMAMGGAPDGARGADGLFTRPGVSLLAAPGKLDGSVIDDAVWLFSEEPSRALIACEPAEGDAIRSAARAAGVGARRVGSTKDDTGREECHFLFIVGSGSGGGIRLQVEIPMSEARAIYFREP